MDPRTNTRLGLQVKFVDAETAIAQPYSIAAVMVMCNESGNFSYSDDVKDLDLSRFDLVLMTSIEFVSTGSIKEWAEKNNSQPNDFLRYGNNNSIAFAISTGRISPWVVYNCDSGVKFLDTLSEEQVEIVLPMIDPDFWQRKFKDYLADTEWVKDILEKAGL